MTQQTTNSPLEAGVLGTAKSTLSTFIDVLVVTLSVVFGSILSISTAAIFGIYALIAFTDLSLGVAITAVALGLNAMLLSLVTLNTLGRHKDE
ncbi:hypothetical protein N8I71_01585 [Roseibacterium sp. SDUM158016]|jgi:hypothetical protein|uniref:hypothetical protein n=1 Tax=Roseicyclus sediminis TaxID=2980997 RepID=UPI0021D02EDE|nr:hypothetical protein [Roseibacterium sp. SDUM158016]MCU4651503.1 hypothetical protein [Roseibacterium sp. SDUM158016]